MDASSISELIGADLAGHPDFFNSHGVALSHCLITPVKREFENSFNQGEILSLWLVLKELPDTDDGYLVVFSEEREEFGLAVYGVPRPVFIGFYGSFTDALSGM